MRRRETMGERIHRRKIRHHWAVTSEYHHACDRNRPQPAAGNRPQRRRKRWRRRYRQSKHGYRNNEPSSPCVSENAWAENSQVSDAAPSSARCPYWVYFPLVVVRPVRLPARPTSVLFPFPSLEQINFRNKSKRGKSTQHNSHQSLRMSG